MTKDEALLMTLATLEEGNFVYPTALRTAIKAALAQPSDSVEHEPVAWIGDSPTRGNGKRLFWTKGEAYHYATTHYPLYTTPPQREWVGLTDDEMQAIWDRYAHMEMMRAIEAALRSKNT